MRRLAPIAALIAVSVPAMAARQVALIADGEIGPPARHGLAKLREALRGKGFEMANSAAQSDYVILAGDAGAAALREWKAPAAAGREAVTVWRGRYRGKPAIALSGGDPRGLMYAALDTAERVGWSSGEPFQHVRDIAEKPYLAERGISMYTMQRAYFESRLYDEAHWKRYFDTLAADRINTFVVIFGYENGGFMAPLYPYFFDVKEFPDVEMVGITKSQQARNTAAFQAMIRLAHERGIAVTAGIWDHIYRGGVQGGGIPGAARNAGQRVPGLVWGVTAENLASYNKAALKRFLEVFPDIDAIQFRMHDESGLKAEEIQPFWHDVFDGIRQTHPKLRLDLRAKGLPDPVIEDALNLGLEAKISTKYWMEQMGLPFHPTHINSEDQRNRRHGYADLLRYPQRYRVHWQLWSGGTTRLLLWGDPEYVRRFAKTARLYDGDSFEVNEMLATKMLGEAHEERPREILNAAYRFYDYEFERYWQFYRLWGRLTYNPETTAEVWEREFAARFGPQAGSAVGMALELASKVLPRVVAASYRYQNFPTTRGWAEMSRQGSLSEYAGEQGSDIQQFLNVRDGARSIVQGSDTAMRRPEETSRWFARTADGILTEVARAEKEGVAGKELRTTIADLKILAGLARYHSRRLLAGVCYNLYKETGNLESFDEAIGYEQSALDAWGQMVAAADDVYSENLAFGAHAVGFSRHWKEEQQILARNFEELQAERQKAVGKVGAKHYGLHAGTGEAPSARLLPVGRDRVVAARVSAPAGVKWVRLRYRHVTQFEDYETAEMRLDAKTGNYTARIPAAFADSRWDLMYFVEVVDRKGAGRMFPDLEVETPYVVIPGKGRGN